MAYEVVAGIPFSLLFQCSQSTTVYSSKTSEGTIHTSSTSATFTAGLGPDNLIQHHTLMAAGATQATGQSGLFRGTREVTNQ